MPYNTTDLATHQCRRGHTATGSALDYAHNILQTGGTCGARDGVDKVVLVIANGKSTETGQDQQGRL